MDVTWQQALKSPDFWCWYWMTEGWEAHARMARPEVALRFGHPGQARRRVHVPLGHAGAAGADGAGDVPVLVLQRVVPVAAVGRRLMLLVEDGVAVPLRLLYPAAGGEGSDGGEPGSAAAVVYADVKPRPAAPLPAGTNLPGASNPQSTHDPEQQR